MEKKSICVINSFLLHLLAMGLMLLDHMWGTIIYGNQWMTNVGRLAYPIFAFLLVEGFFHTGNVKKYCRRLLLGALLSEIPFNLMMGGYWLDPFEQNVMWTFLIGMVCMIVSQKAIEKWNRAGYFVAGMVFLFGCLVAFVTFVDYSYYGILMIEIFYFFRGRKLWQMMCQTIGLIAVNLFLFKGICIEISLFGQTFEMVQQGFAVFALIPIWLYNGRKGPGGKGFQIFCYLFYPVHILLLSLISLYLL